MVTDDPHTHTFWPGVAPASCDKPAKAMSESQSEAQNSRNRVSGDGELEHGWDTALRWQFPQQSQTVLSDPLVPSSSAWPIFKACTWSGKETDTLKWAVSDSGTWHVWAQRRVPQPTSNYWAPTMCYTLFKWCDSAGIKHRKHCP